MEAETHHIFAPSEAEKGFYKLPKGLQREFLNTYNNKNLLIMTTKKNLSIMMLSSIVASAAFTSCSDDLTSDINNAGQALKVEQNASADLGNMEQYSYVIPYEVKCTGKWKIEFDFNEDHEMCYATPSQGEGPATIKVCVLDNWTDERRTGEMEVVDIADPSKTVTVQLRQKCNLDYGTRAGDLVTPNKGNIIYGVGYGYNIYKPFSQAISLNPIIRIEEFRGTKYDMFVTEGVDAKFEYDQYTGSTLHEISNDFKTSANVKGKGFGFEGEIGAKFNMKNNDSSQNEYAMSIVRIKKTNVALIGQNASTLSNYYMCNEAYANINGKPFMMASSDIPKGMPKRKGRASVVAYPSTDEGFFNLIKQYGTHVIIRASLGGTLTYATTIDVSKIEDSYDLKAYAKLNYKCSWASAESNVSDDYKSSFKKNSKAMHTMMNAYGGDSKIVTAVAIDGSEANINAWKESLDDVTNQKVVSVDQNQLIPIYELVADPSRKSALKDYMENRLELDMAKEEAMQLAAAGYKCSTVAHIGTLPNFDSEKENGTLIKDVYMGGQHVARICNEYIPRINKEERVSIVYPVSNNIVKYNLGYWPGNESHRPCRVCFTDNTVLVKELTNASADSGKDLYICGSSFYTNEKDGEFLKGENMAETKVKNAYLDGRINYKSGESVKGYPIVKIFNRIWTRERYCQRTYNSQVACNGDDGAGWYSSSDVKFFSLNNWHMAKTTDFQNLKDGITGAGFNLPVSKMFNNGSLGAEDLTGFNIEWKGWWDYGISKSSVRNGKGNDQMEYMIVNDKGQFGHVRLIKQGSMDIVDNEYNHDNWSMMVRLVQNLK